MQEKIRSSEKPPPQSQAPQCDRTQHIDDQLDDGANLDSGYAWLILAVMFILATSIGGSTRVYGLVFAKEVEVGYYDREQASWPIATASAVENLAGLMSPAIVQLLSWRNIELISTSLFVAANLIAYFSDSLALDVLGLGLVQGLALSIYTVLSLLINNDYFERYRTTAYGVSLCGSTVGLLYLNPLVNWLLDNYDDFRLVYFALAMVYCVNLVVVLFIRPRSEAPKWSCLGGVRRDSDCSSPKAAASSAVCAMPTPTQDEQQKQQRKRSRLEPSRFLESRNSVASISFMERSRRASVMSRKLATTSSSQTAHDGGGGLGGGGLGGAFGGGRQGKKISVCQKTARSSRQSSVMGAAGGALDLEAEPVSRPTGEVELDVATLYKQLAREQELQSSGGQDFYGEQTDTNGAGRELQAPGLSVANFMALLRLPYLHCTWIMIVLYNVVGRVTIIILVDFARDHGLDHNQATQLLNYWSFGELLGRLFLGSLIDMQFLSCRSCISLTCALVAGIMCLMVLVENYLVYALSTMLVAALISLEYMLINVMMVEYIGKHMVTNCYSLAAGIASLVLFGRPSMIGFFRDHLGTYDGLLLTMAGLSGSFALLAYLLEPLCVRYWPKPDNK